MLFAHVAHQRLRSPDHASELDAQDAGGLAGSRGNAKRDLRFDSLLLDGGWTARVLLGDSASGFGVPSPEEWRAFAPRLIEDPSGLAGYASFKYSPGVEVCRAEVATRDGPAQVVCKQRRGEGWRGKLRTLLSGTRERKNFERARLLSCGRISTAAPVALLEPSRALAAGWLITEYKPDLVDLTHVLTVHMQQLNGAEKRTLRGAIVRSLARLLARLDSAGLRHRDLKCSNLMFSVRDLDHQDFDVVLLDLDGLGSARPTLATAAAQLARIAESVAEVAPLRPDEAARVVRAYLNRTPLRVAFKPLFRRARREYQRRIRRVRRDAGKFSTYDR